jgi:hypothetical protein
MRIRPLSNKSCDARLVADIRTTKDGIAPYLRPDSVGPGVAGSGEGASDAHFLPFVLQGAALLITLVGAVTISNAVCEGVTDAGARVAPSFYATLFFFACFFARWYSASRLSISLLGTAIKDFASFSNR